MGVNRLGKIWVATSESNHADIVRIALPLELYFAAQPYIEAA